MEVEGCYAACLDECSGELSREHIISQTVLGKEMRYDVNGETTLVSKDNFVIRNLCRGHNGKLSPFDTEAKRLNEFLVDSSSLYNDVLKSSSLPVKAYDIDGLKVERWMLKTGINYRYRMVDTSEVKFPFKYIANRLFKGEKFEFPFGLSVFNIPEQKTHLHAGEIFFDYLFDDHEIYGIVINLQGNIFFICLPTDNVNYITKVGVPFEGKFYFPVESKPSPNDEYFHDKRLLLWHCGGLQTSQKNIDNIIVPRSLIRFNW